MIGGVQRDRRVISAGKDAEVGARGGEELVKRALNAADNVKDVYSKLPSGMISCCGFSS